MNRHERAAAELASAATRLESAPAAQLFFGLQVDLDRGEGLPEFVVQFVGDPAPLGFLGRQHLDGQDAQLLAAVAQVGLGLLACRDVAHHHLHGGRTADRDRAGLGLDIDHRTVEPDKTTLGQRRRNAMRKDALDHPVNLVAAAVDGLRQLRTPEEVAELRGKNVAEMLSSGAPKAEPVAEEVAS